MWLWRQRMLLHWKLSKWQRLISSTKHSNVKVNTTSKDCDSLTQWPVVRHLFFAKEVLVSSSQEGRPYLASVCLISLPVMFARPRLCCRVTETDGELRRWNANVNSLRCLGLALRFRMDECVWYEWNCAAEPLHALVCLPPFLFDMPNCGSKPPAGQCWNDVCVGELIVESFNLLRFFPLSQE